MFAWFHAQIIGCRHGVCWQGKVCRQQGFQFITLYSILELRGYGQISFRDPLVGITSPSKQLEVDKKLVDWLIISLTPLLKLHYGLMPLYTLAETIQQDVDDFASTVSFIRPFCHHKAQGHAL